MCHGARCNGIPDCRACDRAGAIAPIVVVVVVAAAMARARWCDASLFSRNDGIARGAVRRAYRTTPRCRCGRERDDARRGAGGGVRGRDGVGEFREFGAGDACDGGDVGVLLRAIGG